MSTIFAAEISIAGGVYDLDGITGYTPASGDTITVCPIGPDSADTNSQDDGYGDGNIKAFVEWGSSTWTVKVSDSSYAGKILVIIVK